MEKNIFELNGKQLFSKAISQYYLIVDLVLNHLRTYYKHQFKITQMPINLSIFKMDKIMIILFVLFSNETFAQWTYQNSGTSQDLNEVFFPAADTGFIVGNNGTVLKTINGGLNWNKLNVNVHVDLHELYFLNVKEGWVVGDSGTVCHTTDGGATWNYLYLDSAVNINLHSVYALNSSNILVGGFNTFSSSHMFKSINGGITWQTSNVESYAWSINILKIGMVSNNIGYALSRGMVLKTTDGGLNWKITDTASVKAGLMFTVLEDLAYFPGNDTLFVCGWYPSYFGKSTNAGQNWSHSAPHDYTNLDFINPLIGYVGGWGSLRKTTDGGLTFTDVSGGNTQMFSNIYSIDFTDEWTGYACGKNGKIIKTGSSATNIVEFTEALNSVSIYPNPTSDCIHFSQILNVVVTDLIGQIIIEKLNVQSLDLSEQPKGIYILNIVDQKGQILERRKIIKK